MKRALRHNHAPKRPAFSAAAPRAFTLLELILAAAIFSVLMAALYVVFHGAVHLRETAFKQVESALPVSAIEMIVKRDLNCVMPPSGLFAGAFTGATEEKTKTRSDTLSFYTASGTITDQQPWGDVQLVEYYLADPENSDGTEGKDLVRAVTRNLLPSETEDPEEQRLLHGVQSLLFEYYDGTQWLDYWDSTTMENEMPTAVHLKVEFASADKTKTSETSARSIETMCELVVQAPSTDTTSQSDGGVSTDTPGGGSPAI
jgi:type II secretion system protein J